MRCILNVFWMHLWSVPSNKLNWTVCSGTDTADSVTALDCKCHGTLLMNHRSSTRVVFSVKICAENPSDSPLGAFAFYRCTLGSSIALLRCLRCFKTQQRSSQLWNKLSVVKSSLFSEVMGWPLEFTWASVKCLLRSQHLMNHGFNLTELFSLSISLFSYSFFAFEWKALMAFRAVKQYTFGQMKCDALCIAWLWLSCIFKSSKWAEITFLERSRSESWLLHHHKLWLLNPVQYTVYIF